MWLWVVLGLVVFGGFMALTGAPYVPSKRRDVERAFTVLYPLSSRDVLVDIGSGDGMVLRVARRYGAQAVGYEINPLLVMIARWLSRGDSDIIVHLANFWRQSLPDNTTVIYTFGEGRDIARMYQLAQDTATRLGRPVAFISYGFDVPGIKATKHDGASFLYTADPLQVSRTTLYS